VPGPLRSKLLTAAIALAAAASACSAGDDAAATTAVTTPPSVTTAAPTTTASPTTTEATIEYAVTGPMEDGILEAVGDTYGWMANGGPAPDLPVGLVQHLAGTTPPVETDLEATGAVDELPDGDAVAVVFVGDDTWFLVRDGGPWRIVGADPAAAPPWLGDEPRTLLVLGSDARVGQDQLRYRADSIHVVTVAPTEQAGAIVGFPRDSYLTKEQILAGNEIAGLPEGDLPPGGIKWSSLLASRGPEIMLGTAHELTGIDLEGYIITGFKGFDGLLSFLGGLVIELPTSMRSGNNWANFPAGLQTLDPTRALQLARIRKGLPRGDFDRSFNQGLIMQAAMTMVQDMGVESTPALVNVLLDHAWTDLDTEALFTWALSAFLMEPEDLTNIVMPGSVGSVSGASVVFLDEEALAATSADLIDDGLLNESAG
jgi:LCP family protein required for cell wall assembly